MWVSTWSQGARAAAAMAPKVRLRLKCPAAARRAAGDAAAAAPPAAAPAEGAATPAEGAAAPAEGAATDAAKRRRLGGHRPSGPSGGSKASRERDAANARVAELLLQNQALAQELEAERKARADARAAAPQQQNQELAQALEAERKARADDAAAARLALEGARESHSADRRLWDAMAEANGIVLRRDAQGRHRWPADVRARAAAAPVRSPPPRRR